MRKSNLTKNLIIVIVIVIVIIIIGVKLSLDRVSMMIIALRYIKLSHIEINIAKKSVGYNKTISKPLILFN